MKGLKIIPMFLVLILLSFVGALFVERNPDPVAINFFRFITPPAKLGLVVLSSMMLGMIVAGLLCSVELLALFVQNKNLRRKLNALRPQTPAPRPNPPFKALAEPQQDKVSSSDDDNTGSFNPL